MKNDFQRAFEQIDDQFILDALDGKMKADFQTKQVERKYRRKRRNQAKNARGRVLRYSSLAACACLCVIVGVAVYLNISVSMENAGMDNAMSGGGLMESITASDNATSGPNAAENFGSAGAVEGMPDIVGLPEQEAENAQDSVIMQECPEMAEEIKDNDGGVGNEESAGDDAFVENSTPMDKEALGDQEEILDMNGILAYGLSEDVPVILMESNYTADELALLAGYGDMVEDAGDGKRRIPLRDYIAFRQQIQPKQVKLSIVTDEQDPSIRFVEEQNVEE